MQIVLHRRGGISAGREHALVGIEKLADRGCIDQTIEAGEQSRQARLNNLLAREIGVSAE